MEASLLKSMLFSAFFLACAAPAVSAQCELQTLAPPQAEAGFALHVAQDGPLMAIGSAKSVHFFRQVGLHAYREPELDLVDAGASVPGAMDLDGDTLALAMNGTRAAAHVRVFERQKGAWVETFRFAPDLAANGFDPLFGRALALDGDRLVVGCPGEDQGTLLGVGAVHVFERVKGVWSPSTTLRPAEPRALEAFGVALDLEGDRLAVGAAPAFTLLPKRAYVLERTPSGWAQSDLLSPRQAQSSNFGVNLDLRGDRLLLCDSDAASGDLARVFDFDGAAWTATGVLQTANAVVLANAPFGAVDVALNGAGDQAIVGAPWDRQRGRNAGAAFLFGESAGSWQETEKLHPTDVPFVLQAFGDAVSCEGDLALVSGSGIQRAYTFALDGRCNTLSARPETLSLTAGGRQTLRLNPGPEFAGKSFLLLGSALGTDPGIRLRGVRIPLLRDSYFTSSWPGTRRPPFVNNLGLLRPQTPQALVTIDVPPGLDLALAGLVLHHAFIVYDTNILHVSNVTTLELVP